jgi:hypothetical protein
VADNPRFGVVKRFDLEQSGRPPGLVAGLGLSQHQALAAQRLDARQFPTQVVDPAARDVLVDPGGRRPGHVQHPGSGGHACLEDSVGVRGVEDEEADFFPQLGHVLPSDDADGPLEHLPPSQSSPSSGTGGRPAVNQSGA